jgi:hypothetical protein
MEEKVRKTLQGRKRNNLKFEVIKRALKIYLGVIIEESDKREFYYTYDENKIGVQKISKCKNILTWLSSLAHEVGHAVYERKPNFIKKIHYLISALSLFIIVILLMLKLSELNRLIISIAFSFVFFYTCIKEIRASIYGYKILKHFFEFEKNDRVIIKKYFAVNFGTYLFYYMCLITLI